MASNNSAINAANNKAMANLRALHPEDTDRLLDEAYAEAGLTRRKRLSPEAKAARDLAEAQAAAEAKIKALAEKAGLTVHVGEVPTIEAIVVEDAELLERLSEDGAEAGEDPAATERFREAFEHEPNPTVTVITIPE